MNPKLNRFLLFPIIQFLYGEKISKRRTILNKNTFSSTRELEQFQKDRIQKVLAFAEKNPFYKKKYSEAGLSIQEIRSIHDFKKIPVLTKKELTSLYKETNLSPSICEIRHTSGSTGMPVTLYNDKITTRFMRSVDFRAYGWHGIQVGDKQVRFWGAPQDEKKKQLEKFKDFLLNRIRIPALNISESLFFDSVKKINSFSPKYFYGYVSSVYEFALFCEKHNFRFGSLKKIIVTGETLFPFQKEKMEKMFGVPVLSEYGATETGMIAFPCEQGKMHVMSDNLLVEKEGREQSGEIVITELNNPWAPLIRYKIGDLVEIDREGCSCGKVFPILKSVKGRVDSYFDTGNNNKIYDASFAYTLNDFPEVSQFQVIQREKKIFEILLVTSKDLAPETVSDKLKTTIGVDDLEFQVKFVEKIKKEKSGKLLYSKTILTRPVCG